MQTQNTTSTPTSAQYKKASSVSETVLALWIEDTRLELEVVVVVVAAALSSPPLGLLTLPLEEGMVERRKRAEAPSDLLKGDIKSTLRTCLARRFCFVALRMELWVSSLSFPLLPPVPLCVDEVRLDPTERSCEVRQSTGSGMGSGRLAVFCWCFVYMLTWCKIMMCSQGKRLWLLWFLRTCSVNYSVNKKQTSTLKQSKSMTSNQLIKLQESAISRAAK